MLKNLFILACFTLFVVLVIIIANLYMETTSTTISSTTQQNLTPIEGSFNTKILEELKERVQVQVDLSTQTNAVVPQATITPTPRNGQSPTVSQTITPPISLTVTPGSKSGL